MSCLFQFQLSYFLDYNFFFDFKSILSACIASFYFYFGSTGMAGVPGTANAIFGAVKDVGANVIMISQVILSSDLSSRDSLL